MNHLIELKNISKKYVMGESEVIAVRGVSLVIDPGEFVAIMGSSGSGKSTLMNMLGFLDVPDDGNYLFNGRDVTGLSGDELSVLRNGIAGFVFQQFHLLPKLSAEDNVALPTIYSGKRGMKQKAVEALERVGLGKRKDHYPNKLSGGEQQRVAIARSLINDPVVIFADEPTGNLDSRNEEEIMSLLKKMNSEGKTVIMVTHEEDVASHASRVIRMKDGVIISDRKNPKSKTFPLTFKDSERINGAIGRTGVSFGRAEAVDYVRQAFASIVSHKMRSLLSMLGILIGVASVISMLALGEGAKESISKELSSLGSNILTVMPGSFRQGGVSLAAGSVTRFTMQDSYALAELSAVRRTSPGVSGNVQAVYGSENCNTRLSGVGVDYFGMKSLKPSSGEFFEMEDVLSRNKVALLGTTVVKELFGTENPVGKTVKINRVSFTVKGVLPARGQAGFRDQDDEIIVPVTTAMYRLLGKTYVDTIDVEVKDSALVDTATSEVKDLLVKRNRNFSKENAFSVMDMSEIRNALLGTTKTMSMLLGSVAAISLVVGGVGVMNIMLVSVRERTKEIGLRKAIGARRKDILVQFLFEAVMMTFTGGLCGIVLGVTISMLFSLIAGWAVKISLISALSSVLFSVLTGIFFGIWPAVQASKLNSIEALRYE